MPGLTTSSVAPAAKRLAKSSASPPSRHYDVLVAGRGRGMGIRTGRRHNPKPHQRGGAETTPWSPTCSPGCPVANRRPRNRPRARTPAFFRVQAPPSKKRLSNKQLKRLRKVIEQKEKRALRAQLLEDIAAYAATLDVISDHCAPHVSASCRRTHVAG